MIITDFKKIVNGKNLDAQKHRGKGGIVKVTKTLRR